MKKRGTGGRSLSRSPLFVCAKIEWSGVFRLLLIPNIKTTNMSGPADAENGPGGAVDHLCQSVVNGVESADPCKRKAARGTSYVVLCVSPLSIMVSLDGNGRKKHAGNRLEVDLLEENFWYGRKEIAEIKSILYFLIFPENRLSLPCGYKRKNTRWHRIKL